MCAHTHAHAPPLAKNVVKFGNLCFLLAADDYAQTISGSLAYPACFPEPPTCLSRHMCIHVHAHTCPGKYELATFLAPIRAGY